MHQFSKDLPAKDCPLPTAIDCDNTVYKLFKSYPFENADCQTQAEMGKALNAVGDAACNRHGLSVFPTMSSCLHQLKLFPYLGPYVGEAKLEANHGKIATTSSNNNPEHMTWWSDVRVNRQELFNKVELS